MKRKAKINISFEPDELDTLMIDHNLGEEMNDTVISALVHAVALLTGLASAHIDADMLENKLLDLTIEAVLDAVEAEKKYGHPSKRQTHLS